MNEDRQLSGKCVILTSANGWMNESLTEEWIQYVVGRLSFAPRFLVWDTYKCHMTNEVKEAQRQASVDAALVPGGCTKYIQAPGVSWNKPFKGPVIIYHLGGGGGGVGGFWGDHLIFRRTEGGISRN